MKNIFFVLFFFHATSYCMESIESLYCAELIDEGPSFKQALEEAREREFHKASIQIGFLDALFNHRLKVIGTTDISFQDYQKENTQHVYSLKEISEMVVQMIAQVKNSVIEESITDSRVELPTCHINDLTKLDIARIQFFRFKQFINFCPEINDKIAKYINELVNDPKRSSNFLRELDWPGKSKEELRGLLLKICNKHGMVIKGLATQNIELLQKAYQIKESFQSQTIGQYLDAMFSPKIEIN